MSFSLRTIGLERILIISWRTARAFSDCDTTVMPKESAICILLFT